MRMIAALALFLAPAAYPQAPPTRIQSSYRAAASQPKQALVESTAKIFPHLAMGGGWETTIVIVNITNATTPFTQNFYDEAGNPMTVTVQAPDGSITTVNSMQNTLAPGGSVRFTLISSSADAQMGWSGISYDSSQGRLGGYASFRLNVNGVVNEGLVPLSAYDDSWFVMPFDNTQGYVTALALCNPGNVADNVTITAVDPNGNTIASETVNLAPGAHTAYVITADGHMPSLANAAGALLVESTNTTTLSGLGIRMNSSFGFTSIPIMNFIPGV
jgi:hypothetical protein